MFCIVHEEPDYKLGRGQRQSVNWTALQIAVTEDSSSGSCSRFLQGCEKKVEHHLTDQFRLVVEIAGCSLMLFSRC